MSRRIKDIRINTPGSLIISMVTPDRPPIKKLVLLMAVSGHRVRMVSVMALIKLDTATPDRMMVILEAPVFLAIK